MNLKLLTVEDISRMLGLGKTTVYQLVRQLKHVRLGRKIYVAEEDLNDYIESHSELRQNAENDT